MSEQTLWWLFMKRMPEQKERLGNFSARESTCTLYPSSARIPKPMSTLWDITTPATG
jgi:hypothetical protein